MDNSYIKPTLINKLQAKFNYILDQAYDLRMTEQYSIETVSLSPLLWWRGIKPTIDAEFGTEPLQGFKWNTLPVHSKNVLPVEHPQSDDFFDDDTVNQHFLNQIVRIPREEPYPIARKVLQLALNLGQGRAQGIITEKWTMFDFIQKE